MIKSRLLPALIPLALLLSCQGHETWPGHEAADVRVIFDWSSAGAVMPMNGRTAAFYPREGTGAPVIRPSHDDYIELTLPPGMYDAVFFNETFQDFDGIGFEGTDRFTDLTAVLKGENEMDGYDTLKISRIPDPFAVEVISPLDLRSSSRIVVVHPRMVTCLVRLSIPVSGLKNVALAAAYVSGFPESHDLSEGFPGLTTATQKISLRGGSYGNGQELLNAEFRSLGIPRTGDLSFCFKAVLKDGSVVGMDMSVAVMKTFLSDMGETEFDIVTEPVVIPEIEVADTGGPWNIDAGDWQEDCVPVIL